MLDKDVYISPFSTRYSSKQMQYLFSENFKFKTWRKLWIILAKAEQKLGIEITDEQIENLEKYKDEINYEVANEQEKLLRHDVMAHISAYATQAPISRPIIHLGATSCYVVDNTDIIILKEASNLILKKAVQVVKNLKEFSLKYKNMPCLAYTHLQPAQLTTVGKRATIWINELVMDIENLQFQLKNLKLLGSKGTTGTQASFMKLFENDEKKVKELEKLICEELGFEETVIVSGQTYSRKVDDYFACVMSGIAQSCYKFADDLRILQSFEEVEEPFEISQIGSSAMPYKRNPMRSERICSLARYVIINSLNTSMTSSTQWFERSLDDSANKRITISEIFLAVDSILDIYINISDSMVVNENIIKNRIMNKLPFMATENIMMESVKRGADRQKIHEIIRVYSHKVAKEVKNEGKENNLIDLLANDENIPLNKDEILEQMEPLKYIGRSISQVEEYIILISD